MRLLIAAVVILFLVFWVRAVIDVFKRPDLTRSAQAAWTIGMLVLPFVGLLVYTMLRPSDSQLRRKRR
jgi:phospholipase D-like protein